MGTSDNSPRRSGNHSLWGQNGAMRVQSQLLEDLSWQTLSLWRLSEERHKLGDRPKVGEEHPFPLSANRRPVIIHWKPRDQGGRRKTDHRWPLCGPVDLLPPGEGFNPTWSPNGAPESVRWDSGRAHDERGRRRTHFTVVVLSQNRATDRSTNRSSKALRPNWTARSSLRLMERVFWWGDERP